MNVVPTLAASWMHLSTIALASTCAGSFVLCAAACGDEGCDIDVSELSMVATVIDDGAVVRAEVDFASGDRSALPIPYRRCPDDAIRINGEDAHETIKAERVEYSLTMPLATAPRAFEFEFVHGDDPPVEALVTLPLAFDVTAPLPGALLSQASDDALVWAPAAPTDEMRIGLFEAIDGSICLSTPLADHDYKSSIGVRVPDEGQWTIPAGGIVSNGGDACDAYLEFNRFSYGVYPEALTAAGIVEGRVVRRVYVVSTPAL